MLKSNPPPSESLSKYAPIIHVMKVGIYLSLPSLFEERFTGSTLIVSAFNKVQPEKINLIIGSGGKKVKSIIEETGVESIDTQDDGVVS